MQEAGTGQNWLTGSGDSLTMHTIADPSHRLLRLQLVLTGCLLPAFGAGCSVGDDEGPIEGQDAFRYIEIADASTCVALYAGQTTNVGTVCVAIDNSVDTSAQCGANSNGVMSVTYATTGGWELAETHLAAGDQLGDIPANKKGNPQIGQFPFTGTDSTTTTTHAVPLCSFGLDGADEACDPVKSYMAAHAVVRKQNANGTWKSETAWGDGERIVKKGSWAEYFNMKLECKEEVDPPPPSVAQCETAFALAGNGDETCFVGADFDGDQVDDGFNRWGWTNGPIALGTTALWPVYAAAGQCNLGNGELVGHLSVSYAGGSAQVTFDRVGDFALGEEHLYIGSEPLPRDGTGDLTVAPGQYPVVVELDEATHTTHTVDGLSGDIYVVYHAVACGSFGELGGGGGDGGGTPTDPLASFSDEFNGDLASWGVHHPWDATYGVSNGNLVIEPNANTVWYAGNESFHLNKPIDGNFLMSAFVQVTNLAGGPTAPGDAYRIGGIMVRDPNAPDVNSYHMGIGNMGEPVVTIVSKGTDDSVSAIGMQPWASDAAEMRVCRVGADVQGLIRLPGQPWSIIDWHVRPDLPSTLLAGPISYAYAGNADLRTTCDYVRYETVSTLHECMKD
jgi:hypothetical protein